MPVAKEVDTTGLFTHSNRSQLDVLCGGLIAVVVVFCYHLLIYNRYLPIQEGWFSYYGYLMQHGKLPYRDFYFFTQPISLLISRFIVAFGDKFIYFRYYGIAERALITGTFYYLLSRYFTVPAAVYAAVASSFLFTSYCADAFFSYLYTCLLFFIAALIFLERAVTESRRRRMNLVVTGLFCCMAFFSKQSNGLFVLAAVLSAVIVLNGCVGNALMDGCYVMAGMVAGSIPIVSWLLMTGVWPQYVDQVYGGAVSSKGSLVTILFGFYSRAFQPFALLSFSVLLVATGRLIRKRGLARPSWVYSTDSLLTVALAVCAAVFGGIATVPDGWNPVMTGLSIVISRWTTRVLFYVTVTGFIWVLWKKASSRRVEWIAGYELPIILTLASFFWTYTCGSSYVVQEQSAIPSLGLMIAFGYDKLRFQENEGGRKLVIAAALCIVVLSIWHKWTVAFDWQSWLQPVSVESKHSHWEPISDYRIESNIAGMYDAILDDITRNVKGDEQIATFPFMPMFNVITHRPQPTFAAVHYWDVCPDYIAVADAIRVRAARPKMIINLQMPAWVWRVHEEGFRLGRRSGQREFQKVIDQLTSSGDYKLLRSYLTPFYKDRVYVWLRVDK